MSIVKSIGCPHGLLELLQPGERLIKRLLAHALRVEEHLHLDLSRRLVHLQHQPRPEESMDHPVAWTQLLLLRWLLGELGRLIYRPPVSRRATAGRARRRAKRTRSRR